MTLISELKKPFNIITLILTVLSIALSVVFYLKSKKEKSITYILNEPSSLIFDSKNSSSKIKVYEKDTVPISGNVYLLTGTVWNSGDYPISKSDIRVPLSLDILNSNRILDYKITKEKDQEIAGFSLNNAYSNSIKIDWKYFDPGFGFSFQIIYVGESNPKFILDGKILDIKNFTKLDKPEDTNIKIKIFSLLLIIGCLFAYIQIFRKEGRQNSQIKNISLIVIIITSIILVLFAWFFFFNNTTAPI